VTAVLPIELDPVIARAKPTMRRRRLTVGALLLALAGGAVGATLALRQPDGHSLDLAPTHRLGIARIPGMALVSSDHSKVICSMKGTDLRPQWCDQDVTRGLDQTWALTSAVTRYGVGRAGAVLPTAFARRHPGQATVTVQVRTLGASHGGDLAQRLLRTPDYTGVDGPDFSPLQSWAINGGIAGRLVGPALDGQTELRFAWAARRSVVMVNVLGFDLTAADAQRIASLAGPV
jgi:hypothetical protein